MCRLFRMDFPNLSHKHLKTVVHPGSANLITIPGLLTVEEAQGCIDYAESLGFTHQGSRGPAYGEAFRDNDRVSVQDPGIADMIWHSTGLSKVLKGLQVDGMTAVGCNPNIRLYRYQLGHRFGKHIDDSVELEGGQRTWYTVLVYLSGRVEGMAGVGSAAGSQGPREDTRGGKGAKRAKRDAPPPQQQPQQQEPNRNAVQDLQGGETAFYDERGKRIASIQPHPGLALLHLHGEDRCLEHEALAVVKGTKYVLRTDIVFQ